MVHFITARNFSINYIQFIGTKMANKYLPLLFPSKGTAVYRVIHEKGISEFHFAATHYTHCNNILISNFENNYN
jgi:hypothetical protein